MTGAASGSRPLEALAELRGLARETAESELVAAIQFHEVQSARALQAEQSRDAAALQHREAMASARAMATHGSDLAALDSLLRASRDDASARAAEVESTLRARDEAALAVTRSQTALARAQADEDAVTGRLSALRSAERRAAFAREDDEADERAQGRGR